MSGRVSGVETVLGNLNRKIGRVQNASLAGLIRAAMFIRRRMDEISPLIPVGKTGNLRSSWFTEPMPSLMKPAVRLGFTAEYAWRVHELVGSHIRWSRPGSGSKFLQARLQQDRKQILEIIANEVKIK